MKQTVWTCDRCGGTYTHTTHIVICEDYTPRAIRYGGGVHDPQDWEQFADDETVIDVCPDCLTDTERADRLLRQIEVDAQPF